MKVKEVRFYKEYKEIPIKGKDGVIVATSKIDAVFYDKIIKFSWRLHENGCAIRTTRKDGKVKTIRMHHEIVGFPSVGLEIDHINGNQLDNRISNLRQVTHSQNSKNMKKHKDNTTGFKGVAYFKWGKRIKRWKAQVCSNSKLYVSPYFLTKEEAAKWYNDKASQLFGSFAKLNPL